MPRNLHTVNRYPADLPATPLVPIQLSGEEPVYGASSNSSILAAQPKIGSRATSSAMRSKMAN